VRLLRAHTVHLLKDTLSTLKCSIYTDGAARGNPGPAAIGCVLKDEKGSTIASLSQYLGATTNNQAEYRAVIAAL
jgi:ribonuclease HI